MPDGVVQVEDDAILDSESPPTAKFPYVCHESCSDLTRMPPPLRCRQTLRQVLLPSITSSIPAQKLRGESVPVSWLIKCEDGRW
jgi:hypothetical protein